MQKSNGSGKSSIKKSVYMKELSLFRKPTLA